VFIGDNLPELGSNLVATLSALNMNDLAHVDQKESSSNLRAVLSVTVTQRKGPEPASKILYNSTTFISSHHHSGHGGSYITSQLERDTKT
jgi:hypothetical protein